MLALVALQLKFSGLKKGISLHLILLFVKSIPFHLEIPAWQKVGGKNAKGTIFKFEESY